VTDTDLTVAGTGPTGTFGFGLVPLLQADDRIAAIVGIARRPFDPAGNGWTKMTYRGGDVREEAALAEACAGCVLGAGPPGAYNIAGDGVLTGADVAREAGLLPVPVPAGLVQRTARGLSALPVPGFVPPMHEWAEAISHPSIMDTRKAREELGWRPRYSGLEALRDTIGRDGG
jgi:hypothetical protein